MSNDLVGILLGIGFKNPMNPIGKINFDKIRIVAPNNRVAKRAGYAFKKGKSNGVFAMADELDLFRIS